MSDTKTGSNAVYLRDEDVANVVTTLKLDYHAEPVAHVDSVDKAGKVRLYRLYEDKNKEDFFSLGPVWLAKDGQLVLITQRTVTMTPLDYTFVELRKKYPMAAIYTRHKLNEYTYQPEQAYIHFNVKSAPASPPKEDAV